MNTSAPQRDKDLRGKDVQRARGSLDVKIPETAGQGEGGNAYVNSHPRSNKHSIGILTRSTNGFD